MATTVVVKDEPTRQALEAALWDHLLQAGDRITGEQSLLPFALDAARPYATDAEARFARSRFDSYVDWLSSARADISRVETATLGAAVELETVSAAELAELLTGYLEWIEEAREGFWKGGREDREEILARHTAAVALLDELSEPAVA